MRPTVSPWWWGSPNFYVRSYEEGEQLAAAIVERNGRSWRWFAWDMPGERVLTGLVPGDLESGIGGKTAAMLDADRALAELGTLS